MNDSHKIKGYEISDLIQSLLWCLDKDLRKLEVISPTLCAFQAEASSGMAVRDYCFDAVGALREAESALLAAQRSMEVRGYKRLVDEMAINE